MVSSIPRHLHHLNLVKCFSYFYRETNYGEGWKIAAQLGARRKSSSSADCMISDCYAKLSVTAYAFMVSFILRHLHGSLFHAILTTHHMHVARLLVFHKIAKNNRNRLAWRASKAVLFETPETPSIVAAGDCKPRIGSIAFCRTWSFNP